MSASPASLSPGQNELPSAIDVNAGTLPPTSPKGSTIHKSANGRLKDAEWDESSSEEADTSNKRKKKGRGKGYKKRKTLAPDADVWDDTDGEILDELRGLWRADVYKHYTQLRVARDKTSAIIWIHYICPHTQNHGPKGYEQRARTSTTTTVLLRAAERCERKQEAVKAMPKMASSGSNFQQAGPAVRNYDRAAHRVTVIKRYARRPTRPLSEQSDPEYGEELRNLHPLAEVLDPKALSSYLRSLHQESTALVKEHLSNHRGAFHLALDGWVAPLKGSFYLGIYAVWVASNTGKLACMKLDMINLHHAHTGQDQARKLKEVTDKFGISAKVMNLVLDSASNRHNTLVESYAQLLKRDENVLHPRCQGAAERGRCMDHVMNLVAKAVMRPFGGVKGTDLPPYYQNDWPITHNDQDSEDGDEEGLFIPIAALDAPKEEEELDEAAAPSLDADREAADLLALDGLNRHPDNAIDNLKVLNILPTLEDVASCAYALKKVFTLSSTILDSEIKTQALKFEIQQWRKFHRDDPTVSSDTSTHLVRRIVTRWNSEYACLKRYLELAVPVSDLLRSSRGVPLKLAKFAVKAEELAALEGLKDVLALFEQFTAIFSQQMPLVGDVAPAFEKLTRQLTRARQDASAHVMVRYAAHQGLIVLSQHYAQSEDVDAYRLALLLHTARGIPWMRAKAWSQERIDDVATLARRIFDQFYKGQVEQRSSPPQRANRTPVTSYDSDEDDALPEGDPLDRWILWEVNESEHYVTTVGGPLAWWAEKQKVRPDYFELAQMAFDYLSTPATSVDCGRMFPHGRLCVSSLQTLRMLPDTFRERSVLGSWIDNGIVSDSFIRKIVDCPQ